MRKIIIFFFIIFIGGILSAQINETFENGLPTTVPSTLTTVTLSSGVWKINGAYGKTDNGSSRLAMNTNGYAISPAIDKPVSVSFNHRGSGSGKVLTVYKSIDNGANWISYYNNVCFGNIEMDIEYYMPISLNELTNGMYICVLNIGNQTKSTRLIVIK